ncbi:MAG: hypothetical protein ACI9F9_001071 [Candidatus Paceibacteria bacterium]|jgi:hypothetical protein
MDSPTASLFASLIVSSIGAGLFVYGKKQVRTPQLCTGMALVAFPYFVTGPFAILGTAGLLVLGLVGVLRMGA